MNLTTDRPTVPGWYWYKGPWGMFESGVVCVDIFGGGELRISHPGALHSMPVQSSQLDGGQWAGPIEPPT